MKAFDLNQEQPSRRGLIFLDYAGDNVLRLGKLGGVVIDVSHPDLDFCVVAVVAIIDSNIQLVQL